MRPAAQIRDWLDREHMLTWLQESPDKATYQRRLAVWLTFAGKLHAHKIAAMLGVSLPSIWSWIKRYNTFGPRGLNRQKRGGKTWSYLEKKEEWYFLRSMLGQSEEKKLPSAQVIKLALEKKLGRKVSLSYVYKLIHRHNWPRIYTQSQPYAKKDHFNTYAQPWQRRDFI